MTTISTDSGVRFSGRLTRFAPILDGMAEPLGFDAGDANLRRYVGNSPTNATDPSGLEEADPFPPPARNANFTPISGHDAIIKYLDVKVTYQKGQESEAKVETNTLCIGSTQSRAKQIGHTNHELMSILSYRFRGYAEGDGIARSNVHRPAVFPNGKPVPMNVTGIHNLGVIVEIAAIAEIAPNELTPDYVEERFATIGCRDPKDKDKTLIPFEKESKEMAGFIREAFAGKQDGKVHTFKMAPMDNGSFFDREIFSIRAYLKADKGRIVGGKIHLVLED